MKSGRIRMLRLIGAICFMVAALPSGAGFSAAAQLPAANLELKVLAINDFHGQLGAGKRVEGRPVGSAAVPSIFCSPFPPPTVITLLLRIGAVPYSGNRKAFMRFDLVRYSFAE